VLVILKVQVHLYRPNNYCLCVVCVNIGSSWVIDRLLLQVHGFGTVYIRNYVLWTAILAFHNSIGLLKGHLLCSAAALCDLFFVCRVADVPRVYTN